MRHSKHLKLGALVVLLGAIGVLVWGYIRQVPVVLNPMPTNAVLTVDGQVKKSGDKISFGLKKIELKAPDYTPLVATKKVGIFGTLKITTKLRLAAQAAKVADGDLLRQDKKNDLFYRSANHLYQVLAFGQNLPIAQTDFSNLSDIVFSPDGRLAWVKYGDGVNGIYDFSRYNVTNQEIVKWDKGISAAAWFPSSKASDPDNERLLYLQDGVIYKTDPLRQAPQRLLDLSPEGITNGFIDISADEKVAVIVANGNLYLMQIQALTVSKAASGNVTSATISPTGNGIVYTQNNQLLYLNFSLPDSFSGSPQDIANSGKIIISTPATLGLKAQAKDGYFSANSQQFNVISNDKIVAIDLAKHTIINLYNGQLPAGAGQLKGLNDTTAYFVANNSIYVINLDYGRY